MPTIEFVMEDFLVAENQSNGTIEVIVREIQKQVRVMKSALEERRKSKYFRNNLFWHFSWKTRGN